MQARAVISRSSACAGDLFSQILPVPFGLKTPALKPGRADDSQEPPGVRLGEQLHLVTRAGSDLMLA